LAPSLLVSGAISRVVTENDTVVTLQGRMALP
jgi:hypothetical protein